MLVLQRIEMEERVNHCSQTMCEVPKDPWDKWINGLYGRTLSFCFAVRKKPLAAEFGLN